MDKKDIEKLRDELNLLIMEESDYLKILKVSQELDAFIAEFMTEAIDN